MKNSVCCIKSTTPDKKTAQKIADALVDEKLAACVQIGGAIKSTYVWKGEKFGETEYPISIKTSKKSLRALKKRFAQLHPYECPEWIEIEAKASEGYAKFVDENCGDRAV